MERLLFPVEALSGLQGEPLSQLDYQGSTPLFIAAQDGHGRVVQKLIAAGPLGVGVGDFPPVRRSKGVRTPVEGPRVGDCLRGDSFGQEKSVQTFLGLFPLDDSYTEDLQ